MSCDTNTEYASVDIVIHIANKIKYRNTLVISVLSRYAHYVCVRVHRVHIIYYILYYGNKDKTFHLTLQHYVYKISHIGFFFNTVLHIYQSI